MLAQTKSLMVVGGRDFSRFLLKGLQILESRALSQKTEASLVFQPFFSKQAAFLYGSLEVFGFLALELSQFYVFFGWFCCCFVFFCFEAVCLS